MIKNTFWGLVWEAREGSLTSNPEMLVLESVADWWFLDLFEAQDAGTRLLLLTALDPQEELRTGGESWHSELEHCKDTDIPQLALWIDILIANFDFDETETLVGPTTYFIAAYSWEQLM